MLQFVQIGLCLMEAKENIYKPTRVHSSKMRTARNSNRRGGGGSPPGTPWTRHPSVTRHPHPPGLGTLPVDRHTPVNILPCPKLHLWAVTRMHSSRMCTVHCSGCLGGRVSVQRVVCLCVGGGVVCLGLSVLGVHRILDTRL